MNDTDSDTAKNEVDRAQLTLYMGRKGEGNKRIERLDALCERLGINRSQLITNIADGRYSVLVFGGQILNVKDTADGADGA